jgi:hypothetical protein
VRQRPVVEVGEDLLDDGVAAVLLLGLEGFVRAVGEDGVVAPGGEQLALARRGLSLVADAADDQPGGDVQGLLLRGEGGVAGLGDLGVGGPAAQLVVPDGLRVGDSGPVVFGDARDRGPDGGGDRGRDGEPGPVAAA